AQVGGARAGLDDRALLALLAGDGGVVVVGAVGVAVEDRVDLGGGLLDDLVEDRVGVGRGDAGVGVRAGALVVGGDEDVVLDPGGRHLVDDIVDRVDRVTEVEALDRGGADLADGLGGARADHGDSPAPAVDDRVHGVDARPAAPAVHVGR